MNVGQKAPRTTVLSLSELAVARAEGRAEGKAEAEATMVAIVAQAIQAERARIREILESDGAKGLAATAMQLALSTAMSADDAKKLLSTMPRPTATIERLQDRVRRVGPLGLHVIADSTDAGGRA